jgi:hypothetical protein
MQSVVTVSFSDRATTSSVDEPNDAEVRDKVGKLRQLCAVNSSMDTDV